MWGPITEQYAALREQYMVIREVMAPLRLTRWELVQLSLRKAHRDQTIWWSELVRNFSRISDSKPFSISATVIVMLVGVYMLDRVMSYSTSLSRRGIPILKRPRGVHRWDYEAIVASGARQYPNTPFIITYSGYEYVVYPASCFNEVKRLNADTASTLEYFTHVFFQGWRHLGKDTSVLHNTIALDLSRAVPIGISHREQSARSACDSTIGSCRDWKSFPLYWTIQEIIANTNSTGLVGPRLGTDRRWLTAVQRFSVVMAVAIYISHAVPRLFRSIVSTLAFLPARVLYWYMKCLLYPMIETDIKEYEKAAACPNRKDLDNLLTETLKTKFPIVAWLKTRYPSQESSVEQISRDLITLSFESTPSSALTLYFILIELIIRPDIMEEIREEVSSLLVDGHLPQSPLSEMKKLDSFMRESTRMNPFSYLTLYRRLSRPLKLSVGPELPTGALICVDAHSIITSQALWGDPDSFKPDRFLKMREKEGHGTRHQFTSLGSDSPGWGDGPQGCPGRIFAGNTIKIILAHLLLNYDFRLPDGVEKPKRQSMPNGSFAPDLGCCILVRERKRSAK